MRRGRPSKTDIVSGVEASELQLLGQKGEKQHYCEEGFGEGKRSAQHNKYKMVIILLDANRRKTANCFILQDDLCHKPAVWSAAHDEYYYHPFAILVFIY